MNRSVTTALTLALLAILLACRMALEVDASKRVAELAA